MKVVTYLAFTLLSIGINFVLMDFIQEKIRPDVNVTVDLNITSTKKRFEDVLKHYVQKPHALYYHTSKLEKKVAPNTKTYSNASILEALESTTEMSSTFIDLLYDENSTVDNLFTTESFLTSSEFENVTEITLFRAKNATTGKPATIPKENVGTKECNCNIMYKVCDINCCCDSDCTENDRKVFMCADRPSKKNTNADGCISHLTLNSYLMGTGLENLFCVVKSNLPDKRKANRLQHDPSTIERSYKWHQSSKNKIANIFSRKPYKSGDPIWILRNGSMHHIDLPALNVNSYCTKRKVMKFLSNERIICNVKLTDLEGFHILTTSEETSVVSVTEKSINSTTLNCTTLHCTNWTIMICDNRGCAIYNKSLHEPLCTEIVCSNIAQKIDYIFHVHESKITNATIKLFTQTILLKIPFINQETSVTFLIANRSLEEIVEFSGNPGYISGLPVIVSFNQYNHSEKLHTTSKNKKYLVYPENKNGECALSNNTSKFVLFRSNRRIKCRYVYGLVSNGNEMEVCKKIQNNINEMLGLNKAFVSPFGNPLNVKDDDWIPMEIEEIENPSYGQFSSQKTKLYCYNLITRASFIFTYADASERDAKIENMILSVKVRLSTRNVTLNAEDASTLVSVDTIFIDETKQSTYEYAGSPQLNIHLPKDFFFPFPSNHACILRTFKLFTLIYVTIAFIGK